MRLPDNARKGTSMEDEMSLIRKASRALSLLSAVALLGCAGSFPPHSELPLTDDQVAGLPEGIDRAQLLQKLGPPAAEAGYRNLNETVMSWRLVLPGGPRWFLNAHLDSSDRVKGYSRSPDLAATPRK